MTHLSKNYHKITLLSRVKFALNDPFVKNYYKITLLSRAMLVSIYKVVKTTFWQVASIFDILSHSSPSDCQGHSNGGSYSSYNSD